ncbi:MAG: DMT family transporter [Candidatus Eisenbacteria bacterium]|nr:DMT family transporter [Candidatus Eisenbacteria bacterium]
MRETLAGLRDRRASAFMVGGAFMGPFLGVTLSLTAIRYIDTGVAASITASYPIFSMFIASRMNGEKLTARALLGAAVAVAGVVVLFLRLTPAAGLLVPHEPAGLPIGSRRPRHSWRSRTARCARAAPDRSSWRGCSAGPLARHHGARAASPRSRSGRKRAGAGPRRGRPSVRRSSPCRRQGGLEVARHERAGLAGTSPSEACPRGGVPPRTSSRQSTAVTSGREKLEWLEGPGRSRAGHSFARLPAGSAGLCACWARACRASRPRAPRAARRADRRHR